MVTFKSTKRLLKNNFRTSDDLLFLQHSRVKLLDANNMLNRHEEFGLTKEAMERGFFRFISDRPGSYAPVDKFMSNNINFAIEQINIRESELMKLHINIKEEPELEKE